MWLPFFFFSQLLSMPQVLFTGCKVPGYKVSHLLHPYLLVKAQTDVTITPIAGGHLAQDPFTMLTIRLREL
jgi:hypothetical protein